MSEPGKIAVELSMIAEGFNKAIFDARTKLTGLGKDFDVVAARLQKTADGIYKAGRNISTFLTLPLVAAGAATIKYASDSDENLNKVQTSFGAHAKRVEDWAKTTIKSIGMSSSSAMDAAALFGDMATSMQISTGEAAKMSINLVKLGADLSSFKNVKIDQAMGALKGIFTGEGESLKSLGVVMLDSTLKAYALSKGIKTNYDDMSQAEKVTLRYKFVLDSTKNAQGDFQRTGGGAANQMRVFTESLKQLATNFGQVLLPAFTSIITKVNEFLQWLGSLDEGTKKTVVTIALIAAAIGPVLVIVGKLTAALRLFFVIQAAVSAGFAGQAVASGASTAAFLTNRIALIAVTAATKLWNLALMANPIGLVIGAVVALGAAIYGLYRAFGDNRTAAEKAAQAQKDYKDALAGTKKISDEARQQVDNYSESLSNMSKPAQIKQLNELLQYQKNLVRGLSYEDERRGRTLEQISGITQKINQLEKEQAAESKQTQKQLSEKFLNEQKKVREELLKFNQDAGKNELELEKNRFLRAQDDLNEHFQKGLIDEQTYNLTTENIIAEHEKKKTEIVKKEQERRDQIILGGVSQVRSMANDLGSLFSMYYDNQSAKVDYDLQKKMDAISEQYNAEKQNIENTVIDKKERDAALKALDEKRAREEKAVQEKADKDKRKLAHEAAKRQKQIAIFDTLLAIPESASKAFNAMVGIPYVGPVLGAIAAAAAIAFQVAKLALIQQQPLPPLAKGGYFSGPSIIAEEGKEFAFPFESTQGQNALGLFADKLLTVMENKLSKSSVRQAVREGASIAKEGAQNLFHVIVNVGSKVLYDDISEATANGEILIHARAVV